MLDLLVVGAGPTGLMLACEALRVPVQRFAPTRSQRRVWRRNEGEVRVERHRPDATAEHLRLYNSHSRGRGLSLRAEPSAESDYRFFLVDSCVDTWELRYFVGDALAAVSVVDFGRTSVSTTATSALGMARPIESGRRSIWSGGRKVARKASVRPYMR